MKKIYLKKLAIGFSGALLILFLMEAMLKKTGGSLAFGITNMEEIFDTRMFERDRLLFWRFTPGRIYTKTSQHYKGVLRINSLGFREREVEKEKLAAKYRIFCLGGSNTCGEGIFENERFSNKLEEKLNSRPGRFSFEVYNFGMPGYSTLQMLRLLESQLIYFNCDLIIVNPEQADGLKLSEKAPFPDSQIRILPPLIFKLTSFLEDKSAIYRLARNYLFKNRWQQNKKEANDEYPVRVSLREHKRNLSMMKTIAEGRGIKIVFLSALGLRENKVVNVDQGYSDFPMIDLADLFKHGIKDGLFLDEGHINSKGHNLIAESLDEYIKSIL